MRGVAAPRSHGQGGTVMRDLHFDGEFLRDFNAASKQWTWATWHEIRAAHELTAQRLLEQVFGETEDCPSPEQSGQEGE